MRILPFSLESLKVCRTFFWGFFSHYFFPKKLFFLKLWQKFPRCLFFPPNFFSHQTFFKTLTKISTLPFFLKLFLQTSAPGTLLGGTCKAGSGGPNRKYAIFANSLQEARFDLFASSMQLAIRSYRPVNSPISSESGCKEVPTGCMKPTRAQEIVENRCLLDCKQLANRSNRAHGSPISSDFIWMHLITDEWRLFLGS